MTNNNTLFQDFRSVLLDDFKAEVAGKILDFFPKNTIYKWHSENNHFVNILPPTAAFILRRYFPFSDFADSIISGVLTEAKDEIHRRGKAYEKEEEKMAQQEKDKKKTTSRCRLNEVAIDETDKAQEWIKRTGKLSRRDFEALNNLEFAKPEEAKKFINNLLAIEDDGEFQKAIKKRIPAEEKKERTKFNVFPEILKEPGLIRKINRIPEPERHIFLDRLSTIDPGEIREFLRRLNDLKPSDFKQTYVSVAYLHNHYVMLAKLIREMGIEYFSSHNLIQKIKSKDEELSGKLNNPNSDLQKCLNRLKGFRERLQRKL